MMPLLARVADFFEAESWPFATIAEESALSMEFEGEHGAWPCHVQVREEAQQILFYSGCPELVPEAKRLEMAVFLTLANYGLVLGNFEMNLAAGEILYKTSLEASPEKVDASLLAPLVYRNVVTMDRYLPGMRAVLNGEADPAVALAAIEQNDLEFEEIIL